MIHLIRFEKEWRNFRRVRSKIKFEVVQQFKYLGTIVTNDNNLDKEIRYQISLANNCYHGLKHLFSSQFLNLRTKLNLYKTLLKPVLTYDSECWSLNRRNEEQLQVFERRIKQ